MSLPAQTPPKQSAGGLGFLLVDEWRLGGGRGSEAARTEELFDVVVECIQASPDRYDANLAAPSGGDKVPGGDAASLSVLAERFEHF
jgi:hypothetical protein